MRSFFVFCLLVVIQLQCCKVFAQSAKADSVFAQGYRDFRALVDSLHTFTIYIVAPGSKELVLFNESVDDWPPAFHFLKHKKPVKRNADFKVAVLVDSLEIGTPAMESGTTNRDGITEYWVGKYRVVFNILVGLKDGKALQFTLDGKREFKREEPLRSAVRTSATRPSVARDQNSRTIDDPGMNSKLPDVSPRLSDFKEAFLQLLRESKHRYIDRVDN